MSVAGTFPRNNAANVAVSYEQLERRDPSLHRAHLAFLGLVAFTFILFARPSDIIWSLQVVPWAQLTAIAAMIAYGVALLQGGAPLMISTELALVLGLTVCFVASIPFGVWPKNAFDTLREDWFKTLIIFYLMTQTMFTLDRVRKVLWIIILSMFIFSIFSLTSARYENADDLTRYGGVSKGFFSGTYLGLAVGVTLPYLAALMVRTKSLLKSLFLVSSFGLVMLMVVRTGSRGSMLAVIISLALVWALVLRNSAKARLMGVLFAFAVLVAIAIAPGVFWDRMRTLWDKSSYATSTVSESAEESTMQRTALLHRSIETTLTHPLLGVGIGNFPIVSGTMTGNAHEWKGTHNTYTQISSEAGIPAFLLFVALLFFSIRSMHRIAKEFAGKPEYSELVLLARATQASLLAFAFACCFAHLGYDYYFYYLVGYSVAIQTVYKRAKARLAAMEPTAAPVSNGKPAYGRNEGVGRLRNGTARGRAW